MCGINAIVNFGKPESKRSKRIHKMNDALAHRGPDEEGVFVSKDKKVILGHRRLNIVDIDTGDQPMISHVSGKQYAITYNGEIYNFKKLRRELEELGHVFHTNCDTEVALKAYIAWGPACLNKFNGQFALVIYNPQENKVFMARDGIGIKPLYYSILDSGTLIISSEPKGILSHPDFNRRADLEVIADYFLGSMTFTDGCEFLNRSFFEGLYSLTPGTYGVFDKNGLQIREYYDVPIVEKKEINIGYEYILREKLENAIIDRIPNEVKFGTALSGGLDSSIVTSIVADHSKEKLISCTISFEGKQSNPDFEHANILSRQKNLNLLAPTLTNREMINDLDEMIRAMDAPHDTIRQLGLYATYRNLHNAGCKVALVGEGADEFNLGYYQCSPGFRVDIDKVNSAEKLKTIFQKRTAETVKYFAKSFLDQVSFNSIIDTNIEKYYSKCPSENPLDRIQYYYIKKFLKYRLDANDRCSMAHSIEARVPFCDLEVVKVCLGIPPEKNLGKGTEKKVLRDSFRNVLPKQIIERQKLALPESKDHLFYNMLLEELSKSVQEANSTVWKILNKDYVEELFALAKRQTSKVDLTSEISWTEDIQFRIKHLFIVLTFLRWHQHYLVETA